MRGMTAGSPPESFDRLVSLAEESRAAAEAFPQCIVLGGRGTACIGLQGAGCC
jgi:hypothetical protein